MKSLAQLEIDLKESALRAKCLEILQTIPRMSAAETRAHLEARLGFHITDTTWRAMWYAIGGI